MKLSTWLLAVISSRCQLRIGDAFDVGWWRMVKAKSWHNTTLRYSSTWHRFPTRYQQPTTVCVKLAWLCRIVGNFEDLTGTPDETFWSRTVIAVAKLSSSRLEGEVRLFFYTRARMKKRCVLSRRIFLIEIYSHAVLSLAFIDAKYCTRRLYAFAFSR